PATRLFRAVLEALGSGVPVAASPVTGPSDIIEEGSGAGALNEDRRVACLAALGCSRENARQLARKFTWEAASKQFLNNVLIAQGRPKLPAPRGGVRPSAV
ncbi:glycosyltransferase family 1 protein, partial [Neorhizobium galegae]|nr:glycosyltransferase family 1 protein [Neorhizobium galegae]